MSYFEIQKKLLKKTFTFNKYVIKSGLLDLLSFFMFFLMLLVVAASFQYYALSVQTFEQDYSTILQDGSLEDSFKLQIAENYLASINILITVVVISIIAMLLLSYIFGTFIKTIQYRMINKSYYKGIKDYFNIILLNLRNTLPLFLGIFGLAFLLVLIFGFTLTITIIILILFLIYWALIPILRLCSLRNRKFKKTWKEFYKLILKSIYFMPFIKLSVLLGLIISVVLSYFNNVINLVYVNILLGIIQIIFIILIFVFLRKYLFISTEVLRKNLYKNKRER